MEHLEHQSPLFPAGERMGITGLTFLKARLKAGQLVLVRVYDSPNVATSAAAKLNARWSHGELGVRVQFGTQTLEPGRVAVFATPLEGDE